MSIETDSGRRSWEKKMCVASRWWTSWLGQKKIEREKKTYFDWSSFGKQRFVIQFGQPQNWSETSASTVHIIALSNGCNKIKKMSSKAPQSSYVPISKLLFVQSPSLLIIFLFLLPFVLSHSWFPLFFFFFLFRCCRVIDIQFSCALNDWMYGDKSKTQTIIFKWRFTLLTSAK